MTTSCKMHQRPSELFVELRTASIKCKSTTSQVCREAIAALTKAYWEAPNLSCRTTDPSFKVLTDLFKSCRWNKTTKHCKYHRFWKLCFKIKRPHQTFQRTILFIIHISSFVIKMLCIINHRIISCSLTFTNIWIIHNHLHLRTYCMSKTINLVFLTTITPKVLLQRIYVENK